MSSERETQCPAQFRIGAVTLYCIHNERRGHNGKHVFAAGGDDYEVSDDEVRALNEVARLRELVEQARGLIGDRKGLTDHDVADWLRRASEGERG